VYKVLVGRPKEKRPLRRLRHRWEDGIRWILGRLARGVWNGSTWQRWWALVNTLMSLWVLVPRS
jgi:hypothetical protein